MRLSALLRLILTLCLLVGTVFAGTALSAGVDTLQRGVQKYESADFEEAQSLLVDAINSGYLDSSLLSRAYFYLGLIYLARHQESYAEEVFGRAKGQNPNFKPDPTLFSPAALSLYERAQPLGQPVRPLAPSATPVVPPPPSASPPPEAPRPDGLAATAPAPSPPSEPVAEANEALQAYVIDVRQEDVTIDRGLNQGVRIGERFEIIETRAITHPITGKEIISRRQVALVMVTDLQQDISLAKFVSGRLDLLAPGLEARRLAEGPARPSPPPSQRRQGSEIRIMVMPPEFEVFSQDDYYNSSAFRADKLAEALKAYPKIDAFAPEPADLGPFNSARPSSLDGKMEKLEADMVLFWTVAGGESDIGQLKLHYSLYPRGSDRPKLRERDITSTIKAQREYGPIIAETIAEELKLAK